MCWPQGPQDPQFYGQAQGYLLVSLPRVVPSGLSSRGSKFHVVRYIRHGQVLVTSVTHVKVPVPAVRQGVPCVVQNENQGHLTQRYERLIVLVASILCYRLTLTALAILLCHGIAILRCLMQSLAQEKSVASIPVSALCCRIQVCSFFKGTFTVTMSSTGPSCGALWRLMSFNHIIKVGSHA